MTEPVPAASQERHPWRATVRTIIQGGVGLAAAIPVALSGLEDAGLRVDTSVGAIATALAVSALVTRIMATPQVNAFLAYLGLDADPETGPGNSIV
jgi:hypothetical protein